MTARFQKRHYDAIADALIQALSETFPGSEARFGVSLAISTLADTLEQDNPRFQRERFLHTVYGLTPTST